MLEPAFEITAAASLPERPGPYRLLALDASGRTVFDLSFAGEALDHVAGERGRAPRPRRARHPPR